MSAAVIAHLYESIISEVIATSRSDFQEDGIEESTLQDFRKLWHDKAFPEQQNAGTTDQLPLMQPRQEVDIVPANASQSSSGGALATMRAISQVKQLQARSNGSIQQSQADTAVAHLMQQAQQNGAYPLQPPTAIDNPSTVIKQEPDLPTSINPSDIVLTNGKKRTLSIIETKRPKKSKMPRSDIDLDNEAINSDLDDSDDDALRDDGDDSEDGDIQTVLCLYDKVQRTKNKWKCVLKDGIVNVNGRDFAFNKANGEFEW